VVRHVTWFVGAVENFRFYDLKVHAFTDPEVAVAEVKAEGLVKPTGRIYLQDYVLFLRAAGDKIAFRREYFDPVRAAKALDKPIFLVLNRDDKLARDRSAMKPFEWPPPGTSSIKNCHCAARCYCRCLPPGHLGGHKGAFLLPP
jgi:hypothetical protein